MIHICLDEVQLSFVSVNCAIPLVLVTLPAVRLVYIIIYYHWQIAADVRASLAQALYTLGADYDCWSRAPVDMAFSSHHLCQCQKLPSLQRRRGHIRNISCFLVCTCVTIINKPCYVHILLSSVYICHHKNYEA